MAAKKFKAGATVQAENKDFILLDSFTWKSNGGEKITVGLVVDVSPGMGNIYDTKIVVLNRSGGKTAAVETATEAPVETTAEASGQQG